MNKAEATQLLALIKIAYPTAYRDLDEASKKATVIMWHMSFADVPYPLMEQALNHFRMTSKFPPTVAEMVDELKSFYHQATELALILKGIGDEDGMRKYLAVMDVTKRFTMPESLGGLDASRLQIGTWKTDGLFDGRRCLPGTE